MSLMVSVSKLKAGSHSLPKWRRYLSVLKTTFYRKPIDEFLRALRWGPRAYFCCNAWALEMENAVDMLLPIPASQRSYDLWFLTGSRFWYQTAFCAWTFARHARASVRLHLVDDGSLHDWQVEGLGRIFGKIEVVTISNVRERIDAHLPESKFPVLRQRWRDYVNIRKLTDIHLGGAGPKLVLDSDMLFFRHPNLLVEWLENSNDGRILHMTDCMESYGYSRFLLEKLAGAPIPKKLNVGICGLHSEWLDWEEIEYWCRMLLEQEGTSYYLEQAIVAMMAARRPRLETPGDEYITWPTKIQTTNGKGILQHYVADSKPYYFRMAWPISVKFATSPLND